MPYYSMASGTHLHGYHSLMAYRNKDGELASKNCGLAAAATALRHKELFMDETLAEIEDRFPPDIFFGVFGSSKSRVCEILSAYKCRWHEIEGTHKLKHAIRHRHPVLVMLSLPGTLPAGHWMVAYAFDEHHVHLTNYLSHKDRMKWNRFHEGWGATLPYMIDMDNTGIAIY